HQRVEAQAARRVAAVGIQHHDLPAVLLARAVEIDADGVVQRRLSAGRQTANTRGQTREVALSITTAFHLAREVDECHVNGLGQRCQELDHGLLSESEIELLARTDVEQDADVERRPRLRSRGKREDRLRLAVLVDGEIVDGEIGDESLFFCCYRDADVHEIDGTAEQRGIPEFTLRSADNDGRCHRGCDRENSEQVLLMHVRTCRRIVHRACRALPQRVFAFRVSECAQKALRQWPCDRRRSPYVVISRMTHAAYACHRQNTLGRIRDRSFQRESACSSRVTLARTCRSSRWSNAMNTSRMLVAISCAALLLGGAPAAFAQRGGGGHGGGGGGFHGGGGGFHGGGGGFHGGGMSMMGHG